MTDLITRLSKLDAPDREVDAEIAKSIGGLKANREFGMGGNWWDRWTDNGLTVGLPEYTASVDAAIALAGRVLPGWKRQLFEDFNGKWIARICSQRRELFSTDYLRETELGGSPNGAIALLIALLRAKEATNGQ